MSRGRRRVLSILVPVLFAGGGVAFGFAAARLAGPWLDRLFPEDPGPATLALGALGLVGAAGLAIGVHELGHVLGATRAGLRFVFLTAGPLWVERRDGRLRLRANRVPAAWGGLALCVPTDGRLSPEAAAAYFAGGPRASLVLAGAAALACAGFAAVLGPSVPTASAAVLAALSLAIFVATGLLPGPAHDGSRLRALRRGEPRALAELAILTLSGLAFGGVRPRDWPSGLLGALPGGPAAESCGGGRPGDGRSSDARPGGARPSDDQPSDDRTSDDRTGDDQRRDGRGERDRELAALAELLRAEVERDRGEHGAALERLEALAVEFDRLSAAIAGPLALELAGLWAEHRGDAARARAWLGRAVGPWAEPYARALAEAAIELAEDRTAAAEAALERAEATLARALVPPGPEVHERIARLRAALARAALVPGA